MRLERQLQIERALTTLVVLREQILESGGAQSKEARDMKRRIDVCLRELGLEYNTLNLARFGSRRALRYVGNGAVDGYTIKNGQIVENEVTQ